jgi:hypothetical protein
MARKPARSSHQRVELANMSGTYHYGMSIRYIMKGQFRWMFRCFHRRNGRFLPRRPPI